MLTFVCPICGNNHVIEHWAGLTEEVLISTLTETEPVYEGSLLNDEHRHFVGYFCSNCLYQLVDELGNEIKTYAELLRFISYSFEILGPQRLCKGPQTIMEV